MTPFELVHGVEAQLSLPLELVALNLQKVIEDEVFTSSIEKWTLYLQKKGVSGSHYRTPSQDEEYFLSKNKALRIYGRRQSTVVG